MITNFFIDLLETLAKWLVYGFGAFALASAIMTAVLIVIVCVKEFKRRRDDERKTGGEGGSGEDSSP